MKYFIERVRKCSYINCYTAHRERGGKKFRSRIPCKGGELYSAPARSDRNIISTDLYIYICVPIDLYIFLQSIHIKMIDRQFSRFRESYIYAYTHLHPGFSISVFVLDDLDVSLLLGAAHTYTRLKLISWISWFRARDNARKIIYSHSSANKR